MYPRISPKSRLKDLSPSLFYQSRKSLASFPTYVEGECWVSFSREMEKEKAASVLEEKNEKFQFSCSMNEQWKLYSD